MSASIALSDKAWIWCRPIKDIELEQEGLYTAPEDLEEFNNSSRSITEGPVNAFPVDEENSDQRGTQGETTEDTKTSATEPQLARSRSWWEPDQRWSTVVVEASLIGTLAPSEAGQSGSHHRVRYKNRFPWFWKLISCRLHTTSATSKQLQQGRRIQVDVSLLCMPSTFSRHRRIASPNSDLIIHLRWSRSVSVIWSCWHTVTSDRNPGSHSQCNELTSCFWVPLPPPFPPTIQ